MLAVSSTNMYKMGEAAGNNAEGKYRVQTWDLHWKKIGISCEIALKISRGNVKF